MNILDQSVKLFLSSSKGKKRQKSKSHGKRLMQIRRTTRPMRVYLTCVCKTNFE